MFAFIKIDEILKHIIEKKKIKILKLLLVIFYSYMYFEFILLFFF